MTLGANGTRMDQLSCENCTLRPALVADQCITWISGPVALSAGHTGAFALAACESQSSEGFKSQAFNYSAATGRFCVGLQGVEGCFDTLVMQVPSKTVGSEMLLTTLATCENAFNDRWSRKSIMAGPRRGWKGRH